MLDLFFPKYCILCSRSGVYLCGRCLKNRLKINFDNICHVCGNHTFKSFIHTECEDSTNLDRLLFFCEYNQSSKKLIETFKYRQSRILAKDIATHMSKYLKFKCVELCKTQFIITFVPSHRFKKNQRGFNQSELLAREVARLTGLEYRGMLEKTVNNTKQAGSSKDFRGLNLQNSFKCRDMGSALTKDKSPKTVIIIDDVHTTGATLNECAKVLKLSGYPVVWGLTFAKSLNYSFTDGAR